MKTLILLLISTIPVFSSADISILKGGSHGPTFIDPVAGIAHVNFEHRVPGTVQVQRQYPRDNNGNYVPNYFVVRTRETDGSVKEHRQVIANNTCEDLRTANPNIIDCQAYTALEIVISEPQGTAGDTPLQGYLPIALNTESMRADIQRVSPDNEFVIIRDSNNNASIISSMKSKTYCSLPRRRVSTEGPWNSPDSPLSHVQTSDVEHSFMVGDHTRYFFDEGKGNWCYHFLPDRQDTTPICSPDFNTRTFRIDLGYKNPDTNKYDRVDNRGVVKLGLDANGKPFAVVGNAQASVGVAANGQRPPMVLDETKPLMKISLDKNSHGTKTVKFQNFDKLNGTGGRVLTVTPNYAVGAQYSDSGLCDSSSCLNPIAEVIAEGTNTSAPQFCSANQEAFDMNKSGSHEICYSCTGATPGACGDTTTVIKQSTFAQQINRMVSCRAPRANEPVEPDSGVAQ